MKTSLVLAIVPLLCATPALSQSMDSMPGMTMPMPKAAEKPKPQPKASQPVSSKPAPKAIMPASPSASSAGMPAEPAPSAAPVGDMNGMDMSGMAGMAAPAEEDVGDEPAPAPPKDHAADRFFDPAIMHGARRQLRKEHGGALISKVMLNLGEYQVRDGENGYRLQGEAWFGGDINRFVLKSEGEGGRSGLEAGELQALYSRSISPYFDFQTGVRYDAKPNPTRTYFSIGVEGLAPYWFETESALFLSDHGELLGRLEGLYDLRLTQRWILQPRAEINLAAQSVPEIGVGSGISNVELGLRLRYEFRREFAPYIGLTYDSKLGETANFARARGDDANQAAFVLGVRAWY